MAKEPKKSGGGDGEVRRLGSPSVTNEKLDCNYTFKWNSADRELAMQIAVAQRQDLSGWIRSVLARAIQEQLDALLEYEKNLNRLDELRAERAPPKKGK